MLQINIAFSIEQSAHSQSAHLFFIQTVNPVSSCLVNLPGMKATVPRTGLFLWRSEQLFNIDFASYTLSNHSFTRHFHDHYVIELVLSGADRFYCDGNTHTGQPACFYQPW
jgi:hypothetical protein